MKIIFTMLSLLFSFLALHAQKSEILKNNNLILYYDFEETYNAKLKDISSNGFDGNYQNIKDISAGGYRGKAFEYADADQSMVWLDYHEQHSPDVVTIMAWIYAETDGEDFQRMEILEKTPCYWINRRSGNLPDKADERGHVRGGVFCSETEGSNPVWRYLDTEEVVPLMEWHHIAFVYDTEQMRIYLDGELSNTDTTVFPYIRKNEVPIAVGCRNNANGDEESEEFGAFWDGKLDEVILLGAVLDASDIKAYVESVDPSDIPYTVKTDGFTLYPNPSNGPVTIYTGTNHIDKYSIRIVNSIGQEVYKSALLSNYQQLNLSDLQGSGVYLVQLFNSQHKMVSVEKLIVQ